MNPCALSDDLSGFVSAFPRKRILVLGDAILDEYLLGDCSRISPEAPVPVLKVTSSRQVLGGAGNTAANIVSLGGQASLIALVGSDAGGDTLRRCATDAGIDFHPIEHGATTLRKTRVVAHQQQIVRLDYADVPPQDQAAQDEILRVFDDCIAAADVVVISDYAKGLVSYALMQSIIQRAHQHGCPVIVDPRPQHKACYRGCDYLTPNWNECRALLGLSEAEATSENVGEVARLLSTELHTNVVLSLGPHGIAFCSASGDEEFSVPTLAREVFDVSGAGDTVVAAFALARAAAADHRSAVALANQAA